MWNIPYQSTVAGEVRYTCDGSDNGDSANNTSLSHNKSSVHEYATMLMDMDL